MNVTFYLSYDIEIILKPDFAIMYAMLLWILRIEQCENAHYGLLLERKAFHLFTLLAISMAECLVANKILYCISLVKNVKEITFLLLS